MAMPRHNRHRLAAILCLAASGLLLLSASHEEQEGTSAALRLRLWPNDATLGQTTSSRPSNRSLKGISDGPSSDGEEEKQEQHHQGSSTNEHKQFHVCHVKSVYAVDKEDWKNAADEIPSVSATASHSGDIGYFLFTNIESEEYAKGWTKLNPEGLKKYHRVITQSRYGKFMAWKVPEIADHCRVVVYSDGFYSARESATKEAEALADELLQDESSTKEGGSGGKQTIGLMQKQHPQHETIDEEIALILHFRKDTPENMNNLKQWLDEQNYNKKAKVYWNDMLIYNPADTKFRSLSKAFWDMYSKESTSWRDQPLWAHLMDRQGIMPRAMSRAGLALFDLKRMGRMGFNGHNSYSEETIRARKLTLSFEAAFDV